MQRPMSATDVIISCPRCNNVISESEMSRSKIRCGKCKQFFTVTLMEGILCIHYGSRQDEEARRMRVYLDTLYFDDYHRQEDYEPAL